MQNWQPFWCTQCKNVLALLYLSFNKNLKIYALNVVSVFPSGTENGIKNINIFQGIVSNLEIPLS